MQSLKFGLLAVAGVLCLTPAAWAQVDVDNYVEKFVPDYARIWSERLIQNGDLKPSSHWMGVAVRPTDDVLQKHLGIKGGLVIDAVAEDSPAAKAGMQRHDILLTVGDVPVGNMNELMEFLSKNKDKKCDVKILHEGKAKTVQVVPVERPQDHARFFPGGDFEFPQQWRHPDEIEKWLKQLTKDRKNVRWWQIPEPLRMRFVHPGVVVNSAKMGKLPEGLQVTISKQGDEPARIKVKMGDKNWDVTEDELDKLPEDVRPHVRKFLSGPRIDFRLERPHLHKPDARIEVRPTRPEDAPRVITRAIRVDVDGMEKRFEKEIKDIHRKLDAIQKHLEELSNK